MTWLWILMGLIALLLLAFVLVGFIALNTASVRHKQVDAWNAKDLKGTWMEEFADKVQEAKTWLDGQDHEEVSVTSFDGLCLKAEFVKNPAAKGTVAFFHGYRSQWKIDFAWSMQWYFEQGFNLLLCDQRAHMRSEGKYITYGVREHKDVSTWCQYLSNRLGKDHPLVPVGLSMGAATVNMAAGDDLPGNVRGIIADCGFTSPKDIFIAVETADGKRHPVKLLLFALNCFTKWFAGYDVAECSTLDTLKRTKYPMLLIHGKADGFVPCRMSEEGYKVIPSEKELLLVEGADHAKSFIVDEQAYKAAVLRLLARV